MDDSHAPCKLSVPGVEVFGPHLDLPSSSVTQLCTREPEKQKPPHESLLVRGKAIKVFCDDCEVLFPSKGSYKLDLWARSSSRPETPKLTK